MKKLLLSIVLLSAGSLLAKIRVEAELTMGAMKAVQTLMLDQDEHAIAEFGPIELDGWVDNAGDSAVVGLIVSSISSTEKIQLSHETQTIAWGQTATFVCPSDKVESTILKLTPYKE